MIEKILNGEIGSEVRRKLNSNFEDLQAQISSKPSSKITLLDDWQAYDEGSASNTALSAYLGKDIHDRLEKIEKGGMSGAKGVYVGDDYYAFAEGVVRLPSIGGAKTKLSEFTNDLVPAWALGPSKPSYTASEVGALASTHAASGVTSTKISNWDETYRASHSHSNKGVIDQLTQTMINVLSKLSVDASGYLRSSVGLYSDAFVSSYGLNNSSGGSGGGGSTVAITYRNTIGTHIATFEINGAEYKLYAPTSGGTTEPEEPEQEDPTTYPFQYYCYLENRTMKISGPVGFDSTTITRPDLSGYTYKGYIYHETLREALDYWSSSNPSGYDDDDITFTNMSSQYPVIVFFYSSGSDTPSGGETTSSGVSVASMGDWQSSSISLGSAYSVYESKPNRGNNSISGIQLKLQGKTEYTIYICSYAEAGYDYVVVMKPGASKPTEYYSGLATDPNVIKSTKNSNNDPSLGNSSFLRVDIETESTSETTVWVCFCKDTSDTGETYNDKGYVAFKN